MLNEIFRQKHRKESQIKARQVQARRGLVRAGIVYVRHDISRLGKADYCTGLGIAKRGRAKRGKAKNYTFVTCSQHVLISFGNRLALAPPFLFW